MRPRLARLDLEEILEVLNSNVLGAGPYIELCQSQNRVHVAGVGFYDIP